MCSLMLTALNIPFGPNLASGIGDEAAGNGSHLQVCLEWIKSSLPSPAAPSSFLCFVEVKVVK